MTNRFFLLLEREQKLDARLRLAQACRDAGALEIARLRARKRALRNLLARVLHRSALNPA